MSSPRTIAIAGPKGGIGKSTSAISLAKAMVAKGRHVLILDTNIYESDTAILLEIEKSKNSSIQHTPIDKLDFSQSKLSDINDGILYKYRDYDDIIFDLGSGFDYEYMRLFIRVDFPILIASPEPSSIILSTSWIRKAFSLFASDKCREALKSSDWTFDCIKRDYPNLISVFLEAADKFKCALVLNHRREQNEIYQSQALCHAWGILLGLDIRFFGSIAADDRRWFYARNLADVSLLQREDPVVHDWDTIFRNQLNANAFDAPCCLPMLNIQTQAKQFLHVKSNDEARSAYRMLWEGYKRENGFVANILSKECIIQTISQLEIAYRAANNDSHLDSFSASSTLPAVHSSSSAASSYANADSQNQPLNKSFLSDNSGDAFNKISADSSNHTNSENKSNPGYSPIKKSTTKQTLSQSKPYINAFSSDNLYHSFSTTRASRTSSSPEACAWLKQQRMNSGYSIQQIALKTRISPKIIDKIENNDILDLPPSRLKAYLSEIASVLNISSEVVKSRFGL